MYLLGATRRNPCRNRESPLRLFPKTSSSSLEQHFQLDLQEGSAHYASSQPQIIQKLAVSALELTKIASLASLFLPTPLPTDLPHSTPRGISSPQEESLRSESIRFQSLLPDYTVICS